MTILNFLGNTLDSIGGVFLNFFSFITFNILAPLVAVIGLVIFIVIQYILIRIYIWIGTRAYTGIIKLFDIVKAKWGDKILKIFKI